MNEAISIARDGIEDCLDHLAEALEHAAVSRAAAELTETRRAVAVLALAMKELAGAVEQQERRIMRLEQRR